MNSKCIILLASLVAALTLWGDQPERSHVSPFLLEDQFGAEHSIRFPTSKPVLIAIADREGADDLRRWIDRCKMALGDSVLYVGIADVRKAPAFLREYIRKQFRKKYEHPVLLDWSGAVTEPLAIRKGTPNVLLASPEAAIVARETGAFEEAKLSRLKRVLSETQPDPGQTQ